MPDPLTFRIGSDTYRLLDHGCAILRQLHPYALASLTELIVMYHLWRDHE